MTVKSGCLFYLCHTLIQIQSGFNKGDLLLLSLSANAEMTFYFLGICKWSTGCTESERIEE